MIKVKDGRLGTKIEAKGTSDRLLDNLSDIARAFIEDDVATKQEIIFAVECGIKEGEIND